MGIDTERVVCLRALDAQGLDAFAQLLGSACFGGCFCAVWTSHDDTWGQRCADPRRPNLAITRRDVLEGRKPGFFVHVNDELAGWVGAGPRDAFPLLETKLASRLGDHTPAAWAVGCLAFLPEHRGTGLAPLVVEAVADLALEAGAQQLEAYPTRPWDEPRSYRGALSMYDRLGFVEAAAEPDGDAEIILMVRALRRAC